LVAQVAGSRNERGAGGTKERGLRREAELGVADGDPFEVARLALV
jgi:hypothetical protein